MGVIVLMGSGELSPTMAPLHRRLLADKGDHPHAVFLDAPFGFQENADELTARIVDYFATSLGIDIATPGLRSFAEAAVRERERVLLEVRRADYVFSGPGSPSYALEQWHPLGLANAMADALGRGATVTLASAAAVTAGTHALPVYEIYKVGAPLHWLDGLGIMTHVGVDAAVVPHFDNAEGGTHDTRYCYMGRRRFDRLREMIEVPVLGVDEHTAAIVGEGRLEVYGRGSVTIVRGDDWQRIPGGEVVALADLGFVVGGDPAPSDLGTERTTVSQDAPSSERFDVTEGDSVEALLTGIEDPGLRQVAARLAEAADRGRRMTADRLAPLIELAVRLRDRARARGDWSEADEIREELRELGVELRDTSSGTEWSSED